MEDNPVNQELPIQSFHVPLLNLLKRYTERMSSDDLVVVQSYATEGEAEVAKGVLESSGIRAMIQADTAGRMREHLAWSGLGHRVLVREDDAAAARSLLAARWRR